jgi:hypothetical protein
MVLHSGMTLAWIIAPWSPVYNSRRDRRNDLPFRLNIQTVSRWARPSANGNRASDIIWLGGAMKGLIQPVDARLQLRKVIGV